MDDDIFGILMNLLPTVGFLYHFCSHAHAFFRGRLDGLDNVEVKIRLRNLTQCVDSSRLWIYLADFLRNYRPLFEEGET